jgi:hypothetical protein
MPLPKATEHILRWRGIEMIEYRIEGAHCWFARNERPTDRLTERKSALAAEEQNLILTGRLPTGQVSTLQMHRLNRRQREVQPVSLRHESNDRIPGVPNRL